MVYISKKLFISEIIVAPPFDVHQWSILGPLLFTIYINDLQALLKHLKHLLYADDVTIYISGTNIAKS